MSYKNITAPSGIYQLKNGETRKNTELIGQILDTKYGEKIKIKKCFLPGFDADEEGYVWCSLHAPKPKDFDPAKAGSDTPPPPQDDDLPF